ncbi:MAG: sugar ABC transporter permease [Lachnospiraceae bacterium]|jgi:multiple sugar transport system permease protein|nr:sugar ABC transporter permease [Lachnospiraceae bacterium]
MAANKISFKRRAQLTLRDMKRSIPLYAMIAPFMLLFFVFVVYPVLKAIWFSFTDYNVLEKANFVGLRNYKKLFLDDSTFITAIKNTFIIAVIVGPGGYIMSFLLAWMINELPHKIGTVLTVIFYAPSMAGTAVITVFAQIFSNDSNGYLNAILRNLGITNEAILWLSDADVIIVVVILASLWMSMGVGFLSFVAGIKGVDEAQYEAGAIDGIRNRWQELWYVTLPNMKPQLLFGAVMTITSSLSVGSIGDSLVGFPSPNYATHTIVNHLNDYGSIRMEMGYASAIAVILFLIMILCNMLIQRLLRKVGT